MGPVDLHDAVKSTTTSFSPADFSVESNSKRWTV